MDTNQILTLTVFVVVITIVGTIALAAVGYFAFRLRERRNPSSPGLDETMAKPYFFERVRLPARDAGTARDDAARDEAATSLPGSERPALESGSAG